MRKIKKFISREADHQLDYYVSIEKKIEQWMAQEQPQNTEFHFVTENLAYVLYDEAKPQVLG